MLEGQLEVSIIKEEEEPITSVYQSSHNILPTLLGYRWGECTCMELNIKLNIKLEVIGQMTMDHSLLVITMSHVRCVTLQQEGLL